METACRQEVLVYFLGDTKTKDEEDLSAATLASDVLEVFKRVFQGHATPPVLLIGHSLGGAIGVHVGAQVPNLVGLVVIDVVEGSAMAALQGMGQFLAGRPQGFQSLQQAIQWCLKSGTVKNLRSARVSMPGQVRQPEIQPTAPAPSSSSRPPCSKELEEVSEEEEEASTPEPESSTHPFPASPSEASGSLGSAEADSPQSGGVCEFKTPLSLYTWRIDLKETARFWEGWFAGLSKRFLAVPVPKLLLLAGVDRLDKELTVGQMQGKFQMVVLPKVGHALHEDSPEKVAAAIATFCTRNKLAGAKAEFEPVYPGC